MHRPKIVDPPAQTTISQEEIEQGIARARHLRAKAYGDFFSTLNRKVASFGAAARRPKLSPMEPSGL